MNYVSMLIWYIGSKASMDIDMNIGIKYHTSFIWPKSDISLILVLVGIKIS